MRVAVLTPVLGRPDRVEPLLESLEATQGVVDLAPLFLISKGDLDELETVKSAETWYEVMRWKAGPGDYARKMNHGIETAIAAKFDFVFLGADDLVFWPGWIERALAVWQETRACVIGTNDLGNQRVKLGRHSTHTLVHLGYRECGTIDDPTRLLHEGYDHNYVDDEFVQTALYRDTFVAATDSIVEHLHPDWGKGRMDDTYRKGKERFHDDLQLYKRRCKLWGRSPHF